MADKKYDPFWVTWEEAQESPEAALAFMGKK